MFLDFFFKLKNAKIPVSLNEYLNLLNALDNQIISYDVNAFYYLARTCLIKDEKLFDRFDLVFGEYFKSIERIELEDVMSSVDIPDDWIKQMFNRYFTEDEINRIKSQGGIEKLLKTLKQRLKDQKKRHQGGNKWIGTSGTSPFGAYGYNPEGIRIGQDKRRHGKAIKVWDKRIFKDFDNTKEFNNRSFYFVHSYMANLKDSNNLIAYCDYYDLRVPAIVQSDNVFGCQFHPEKSGKNGLKLLKNILKNL